MALAEDVAAERAALTDALSATGASAPAGCGTWTARDLAAVNPAVHAAPPTLVQAIPPLLRYQFAKLPAGVAVTVGTDDGHVLASVGPRAEQAVLVRGTPANLVRWLAGRHTRADVELAGPAARVQELRTFEGHV